MTTAPESSAAPAPKNLVARFVGVIVSPQETFKSVVAHPKWLGMLAVITLFLTLATTAFLSTEVGRNALLDQQIASMESFGVEVSDQQIAQMEQRIGIAAYFGGAAQLVTVPIVYVIMAGILFAIFNAGMGGTATFKQVFAVVVHAGAVSVVQQAFALPLTQFGRPEIPSPSVSAESALARMTASGIASIRPAPNTGGGSLTETSTAEGSRSGSAPAMAFSWSCGPPTSSAGSLPRLNRVRAF